MSKTYLSYDDTGLEINGVKQSFLFNPENLYHPSYYSKLYGEKKYTFANTLYAQFFIQRYLPLENSLRTIRKTRYIINKTNFKQVLLFDMGLKFKYGFKFYLCQLQYNLYNFYTWINFFVYSGISFVIAFKSSTKNIVNLGDKLVIANSNTSFSKLKNHFNKENINLRIFVDPIQVKNGESIFNLQSRYNLLNLMWPALILAYLNYKESIQLMRLMTKNRYGDLLVRDYLSKRVFYTALFELMLQNSLEKSKVKILYSGVRDDRYSTIIQDICNRLSIDTFCIPHGLAYSYKYPNGLFGDSYLAYSKLEADRLSQIYFGTKQKFIYESNYKRNTKFQPKYKLVYFTNSRDVCGDKNNISNLLTYNKTLMVRLHPNDLKSNYKDINNIYFIDDFSEALSAEYVISKPSTVLLDGLKNGCKPIALLLTNYDIFAHHQYPAFEDKSIIKIYELKTLKKYLS
uniref:hypothetical protein n=1 Tax=Flavobacterium sp. TaxID=239 RepID=UPI004049E768